jgi:hypothetical protein
MRKVLAIAILTAGMAGLAGCNCCDVNSFGSGCGLGNCLCPGAADPCAPGYGVPYTAPYAAGADCCGGSFAAPSCDGAAALPSYGGGIIVEPSPAVTPGLYAPPPVTVVPAPATPAPTLTPAPETYAPM